MIEEEVENHANQSNQFDDLDQQDDMWVSR